MKKNENMLYCPKNIGSKRCIVEKQNREPCSAFGINGKNTKYTLATSKNKSVHIATPSLINYLSEFLLASVATSCIICPQAFLHMGVQRYLSTGRWLVYYLRALWRRLNKVLYNPAADILEIRGLASSCSSIRWAAGEAKQRAPHCTLAGTLPHILRL